MPRYTVASRDIPACQLILMKMMLLLLLMMMPRYTVASRDIPACQLILREPPALHGPYTKTTPVCLSCYAKVRLLVQYWRLICFHVLKSCF